MSKKNTKVHSAKDLIEVIEEWLYREPASDWGRFEWGLFSAIEPVEACEE